VFMGLASEKGKGITSVPIEQQLKQYATDVMRHASGLSDEQKNAILSGVDGSHAAGLSMVPFDGYRAELHRGEEVLTANDPRNQNNGGGMVNEMRSMLAEMRQMAYYTKRTSDLLLRVTRDGDSLVTVTA